MLFSNKIKNENINLPEDDILVKKSTLNVVDLSLNQLLKFEEKILKIGKNRNYKNSSHYRDLMNDYSVKIIITHLKAIRVLYENKMHFQITSHVRGIMESIVDSVYCSENKDYLTNLYFKFLISISSELKNTNKLVNAFHELEKIIINKKYKDKLSNNKIFKNADGGLVTFKNVKIKDKFAFFTSKKDGSELYNKHYQNFSSYLHGDVNKFFSLMLDKDGNELPIELEIKEQRILGICEWIAFYIKYNQKFYSYKLKNGLIE